MKDSYYFPHDYHARHDPKLEKLRLIMGCEGLGIFWCLVEMLYEENGYLNLSDLNIYSKSLNTDLNKLNDVIKNYGLFKIEDEKFYSIPLLQRLEHLTIKRQKARESAESRWNANALRPQCDGNARKESKGKESTINMFETFWSKYPKKQGKAVALKSFLKISPNDDLFLKILGAVDIWSTNEQWTKENGKFVPMPSTWLNQERWNDEVTSNGYEQRKIRLSL